MNQDLNLYPIAGVDLSNEQPCMEPQGSEVSSHSVLPREEASHGSQDPDSQLDEEMNCREFPAFAQDKFGPRGYHFAFSLYLPLFLPETNELTLLWTAREGLHHLET
ncbi:hypothetical protein FB45DRAFT_1011605 [Roridomyces roridus]|uniref:Uncharacterized protein n=1 Tax=Roridomyces roridus TaxID=1738132 RepID=A0AAD7B0V5_9AGAR|nr:hypothetical protein FB45DRAFT_1011605 [Roridomyces roridus]